MASTRCVVAVWEGGKAMRPSTAPSLQRARLLLKALQRQGVRTQVTDVGKSVELWGSGSVSPGPPTTMSNLDARRNDLANNSLAPSCHNSPLEMCVWNPQAGGWMESSIFP